MNIIENTTITMLPISRLKNNSGQTNKVKFTLTRLPIDRCVNNEGQIPEVPANPRTLGKMEFERLKKKLRELDFTAARPLIAYPQGGQYVVFCGNQRLRALREIGETEINAAIVPEDMSAEELRKILLADNVSDGEWDTDMFANDEFSAEEAEWAGVDEAIWNTEGEEKKEAQEDDFDEDKDKVETVCKKGDIWLLGQHRLMCGDSTNREDIAKLMQGQKADLTFTSPPYNGDNSCGDGDIFQSKRNQRLYADGYSDDLPSSEYVKFASSVLGICFENTEGFIFWNVSYNSNSKFEYIQQIVPYLPLLIEQVVWKKSSAIPLKGCMRRAWEPVYIFSNTRKNLGTEVVETNIWEISNTHSQGEDHKACFPVGLPAKGISLVKPKTGIVLEPFGGTGTTMIAAEQLGRKCYMMELDPHYCDIIIARWEKLTGQKACKL